MPFTAHDLRYHAEDHFDGLYAYLSRHAQQALALGQLKYDSFELETVIYHVIEQLLRLGVLGGGDHVPHCAIDDLPNPQFYAFLNNSIRNKAIDRMRKRRLPTSTFAELEAPEGVDADDDPLNDVIDPLWGAPLSNPEEIILALASQQELRAYLIHCLLALKAAPKQLRVVIKEIKAFDADEVLQGLLQVLQEEHEGGSESESESEQIIAEAQAEDESDMEIAHASQHKDHAHKKLRHCLQQQSTNLTVKVVLRLTEYGVQSANAKEFVVPLQALAQDDLSDSDVRAGLNELVREGLLHWQDNEVVHISSAQMKRLLRFYREE
jgi:hypothetical protein